MNHGNWKTLTRKKRQGSKYTNKRTANVQTEIDKTNEKTTDLANMLRKHKLTLMGRISSRSLLKSFQFSPTMMLNSGFFNQNKQHVLKKLGCPV